MTSSIGDGVVGLADLRQQQELHVEHRIGRENHELRRLLPFFAAGVHERHPRRPLAGGVEVDAHHLRIGPKSEIRLAQEHRQDRRLRTRLGIVGAAEPFAEAAIAAGAHPDAERIDIRPREIARGLREGFVAKVTRCLTEKRMAETLRLRRSGIGPRARTLERVSAVQDLPLQIARLPGRAAEVLKLVVVRLEVLIGDAPILDRHVGRQEARAVALRQMCLQHEVAR